MRSERGDLRERHRGRARTPFLLALFPAVLYCPLAAQVPPDLARERADFAHWLQSAPNSPLVAVAHQPIGGGLTLGPPDSDIPLPGLPETRIEEQNGAVTWTQTDGRRALGWERVIPVGAYAIYLTGSPGHAVLEVFGGSRRPFTPTYYPYDSTLALIGTLSPASKPRQLRILTLDGVEVEATDAGTLRVSLAGTTTTLRVYRIPDPATDEWDLTIYFRDGTSDRGSYPAGRFVSVAPLPVGRYRLDFNRARNPFCAYSSVYPCPVPWPGNTVDAEIRAGEMYPPK